MAARAVSWLLAIPALRGAAGATALARGRLGNEALDGSAEAQEPYADQFLELGSRQHLERASQNLTLAEALRGAGLERHPELREYVHSVLGERVGGMTPAFLQVRSRAAIKASAQLGAMSADTARALLNKMAEEAQGKLDLEATKCADAHDKQSAMTENARQDIGDYNAQAAAARARILGTQTGISSLQDKLPHLSESLKIHKSKCEDDLQNIESQIHLVERDLKTLAEVSKLNSCNINLGTTLLECKKKRRHPHHEKEGAVLSFLTFGHQVMRRRARQLRSQDAQDALQQTLAEVASMADGTENRTRTRHRRRPVAALQTGHRRKHRRHHRAVPAYGKPPTACTVRSKPTCDTLLDKFLVMQATISDKADALRENMAKVQSMCKATEGSFEAQMEQMQTRLQDQQAALAEATKIVIEAEEQSRMTGQSLQRLQQEAKRMAEQCGQSLEQISQEICNIKQIRGELYKMEAKRPFIQDCEVSPWMPEECSEPCGGGVQKMVRSVVVPASLGAACPPLVMKRRCNVQACPTDCSLSQWGGWSSCSAQCGGGIMERVRSIRRQPSSGGRPCEATSESAMCSAGACDRDCTLSEWTRWSSCSKACDGGFQVRKRDIGVEAKGQGSCPSPDSEVRLQYRRCNSAVCKPKTGDTLKCKSKLDIVLILDGSGSIGEAGWAKVKSLGGKLVQAIEMGADGAQVAVLLYSGPKSWPTYRKCTGAVTGPVDLATDCNLNWVSHFASTADTLASAIGGLTWPKASTLTSAALATAEAELRTGRSDASSLVIAITDGKTMDPRRTTQAAKSLQTKARLMWVPVSRSVDLEDIKLWASKPVADNVVLVQNFDKLDTVANVNRIIADACPEVE